MRRAVALLAVLLPLSLMPASASGYEPSGGATFNTPVPWGSSAERSKIVRKVEEAIRHIRPTRRDPRTMTTAATPRMTASPIDMTRWWRILRRCAS